MVSQNDYEWLFRKAPVMTTSIAEDGTYLDVNDAMLERLGYELDYMVGRKPEDFATPDTAERIVAELRPALRRRGKLENKPFSLVTSAGEVVDCIPTRSSNTTRRGNSCERLRCTPSFQIRRAPTSSTAICIVRLPPCCIQSMVMVC